MAATGLVHIEGSDAAGGTGGAGAHGSVDPGDWGPGTGREAGKGRRSPGYLSFISAIFSAIGYGR